MKLNQFICFDRLEVGPPHLEPKKLTMPYRLVYGGGQHVTHLVYSYDEPVFTPGDPAAENLAAMIGAQVALNYGLFCRAIVFHGHFEPRDQQLLRDMAANTATEIYVKKLLEHNPFLLPQYAHLELQPCDSYLQAELLFPGLPESPPLSPWPTDERRHCVLSSGGKDSLVGFGLLRETGCEVHPIYINESGRHWFTALNAYNYFKKNIPFTGRVWCNCDRVFNWMLRHMPFIRKDFQRIRADEYPIRLWTVAVFLFGALPLMRKKGVGRLVIGDEYDTTRMETFRGIAHYDGLYDQSRFFDIQMSRYFSDKGWNIRQFSILRPLSDFLILKVLVKRYPELQAFQVSCHAGHKEGDRVHPCGRCEKCRRIVGMLSALGADHQHCGYHPGMVRSGLESLKTNKVTQESACAHQVLSMLAEAKLLELPESLAREVKPHPEVLHLRFHPDFAQIADIPVDLQAPLFRIYLQYALGALRWNGDSWQSFDLLTESNP